MALRLFFIRYPGLKPGVMMGNSYGVGEANLFKDWPVKNLASGVICYGRKLGNEVIIYISTFCTVRMHDGSGGESLYIRQLQVKGTGKAGEDRQPRA